MTGTVWLSIDWATKLYHILFFKERDSKKMGFKFLFFLFAIFLTLGAHNFLNKALKRKM